MTIHTNIQHPPEELRKYADELKDYYAQLNEEDIDRCAKKDLRDLLISQYAKSASQNMAANEKRLYYRNFAFKGISVAIILLALTSALSAVSLNTEKGETSGDRQTASKLSK
jgi:hypothetical protein